MTSSGVTCLPSSICAKSRGRKETSGKMKKAELALFANDSLLLLLFTNELLPWVSPERGVVERVEAVVVGEHEVCRAVEQQGQHVVTLLGDGVVHGSVALRVLQEDNNKRLVYFLTTTYGAH